MNKEKHLKTACERKGWDRKIQVCVGQPQQHRTHRTAVLALVEALRGGEISLFTSAVHLCLQIGSESLILCTLNTSV